MKSRASINRPTQAGFTLIELMIVVAILGILASLAMASYRTYTIRAQVSEGLGLVGPVKAAMSEFYNNNGAFPADNTDAGLLAPGNYTGKYVTSVSVTGDTISILYGNDANAQISGQTVSVIASGSQGSLTWDCASGGVISDTLLPQVCR